MSAAATSTWRAFGTYATLGVDRAERLDTAVARAQRLLDAVDATCSRVRPDSDLTRANGRPGTWVRVDPLLCAALEVALAAARVTDGLVDPCLGRRLLALGYDDDNALNTRRPGAPLAVLPPPAPDAWREVEVDPDGAVRVPAGVALDLGATGKAWASDLVAATLVEELGLAVQISLGGDVALAVPEDEPPVRWPVVVTEHPGGVGDDLPPIEISMVPGGLATSSTAGRRWAAGTVERHHLLDPRTGMPTTGPWRTVTATGPTCVAANVATTAALVVGAAAIGWLEERGVSARLVGTDGRVAHAGDWPGHPEVASAG